MDKKQVYTGIVKRLIEVIDEVGLKYIEPVYVATSIIHETTCLM